MIGKKVDINNQEKICERENYMEEKELVERQKIFLVKFAYWLIWAVVAVVIIKCIGSVLLPFVVAFAVALALKGPVDYAARKSHIKRQILALAAVIGFYGLAALLLYLFGSRALSLVQDAFGEITQFLTRTLLPMVEKGAGWLEGVIRGTQEPGHLAASDGTFANAERMLASVSDTVIEGMSGIAAWLPGACMNLLITVIATVFMELEISGILEFLRRQIPDRWQQFADDLKADSMGTFGRWLLSYALILAMTFGELAIGFLILSIDGAFVIAFVIAVLDILPVLGTGTVLIPWAVIAMSAGNLGMGFGVLALYLVITVVRNIVEPKLVGRQMGLSPVVMLPSMIIGLKMFGLIGLFGVPFGLAFLKKLNDREIIHLWKV